jgi:hypothetical protein
MKQLIIVVIAALIMLSCQKDDTSTIDQPITGNDIIINGSSGIAEIEGRVGYFSPSLPPPNFNYTFPYPAGYQLGEYHWITADTPKVSYRIYLDGDYGQFENHFVRIKGSWREKIIILNNEKYPYLIITVDSLREI